MNRMAVRWANTCVAWHRCCELCLRQQLQVYLKTPISATNTIAPITSQSANLFPALTCRCRDKTPSAPCALRLLRGRTLDMIALSAAKES